MRYFNTSGPNIPAEHYSLPRLDWVEKGKALIYLKRYFTIWAPRQTGKSTYFRFLAEALEKEGYKTCIANFENYKEGTMKAFLNEFHFRILRGWGLDLTGKDLAETFTTITQITDQKLVLVVDEVEGINPDF